MVRRFEGVFLAPFLRSSRWLLALTGAMHLQHGSWQDLHSILVSGNTYQRPYLTNT